VTRAPGPDGFSSEWLKLSFDLLSGHLLAFYNTCLAYSHFPSQWRITNVIILRKQNKPSYLETNCFRPISILGALSKLFEKLIHSRLKKEASSNNWFNDAQHGFRDGRSTVTACSALATLLESNFKKRLHTACAFLDIKSAFDSAWQPAILSGLLRKGCPLYLVKLMRSFLSNRRANLSSLGATLQMDLELGCPQGSVLSPFLWNVLIDQVLGNTYPFPCLVIAYADDIVLCAFDRDPLTATSNLQSMCNATVDWGKTVKLSFNALKTVFIIFTRCKPSSDVHPSLSINNTLVSRTSQCTYLGMLFDEKLSWKDHVAAKCIASKRLMLLVNRCFRLTWGISRKSLTLMYKSIFLPMILYGCSIWGGATRYKWCVKSLQSAQRPLVLSICRAFKTTSTLAAALLSDVLPLELEIKKLTARRAVSNRLGNTTPSAMKLVDKMVTDIHLLINSNNISPKQARIEILNRIMDDWNQKWKSASVGSHTRRFFPSVPKLGVLFKLKLSFYSVQVLTGHCFLNYFLAKINRSASPLCLCLSDIETVEHFLFNCTLFTELRVSFKYSVLSRGISWPPELSAILENEALWSELTKFVLATKRLEPPASPSRPTD
jgi:hypothetical protein